MLGPAFCVSFGSPGELGSRGRSLQVLNAVKSFRGRPWFAGTRGWDACCRIVTELRVVLPLFLRLLFLAADSAWRHAAHAYCVTRKAVVSCKRVWCLQAWAESLIEVGCFNAKTAVKIMAEVSGDFGVIEGCERTDASSGDASGSTGGSTAEGVRSSAPPAPPLSAPGPPQCPPDTGCTGHSATERTPALHAFMYPRVVELHPRTLACVAFASSSGFFQRMLCGTTVVVRGCMRMGQRVLE